MFSSKNESQMGAFETESSGETQIEAYVNEAYAETYITQIYFNNNDNPVELTIDLPNEKGVQFLDFEVEIKDKKVKSKVITKEKAEQKYSDAIAEGNTAIYCEFNQNQNKYVIHLGNIEPKTKVIFKSHFHQKIISNDLNYIFKLMNHFPFPRKSQYDSYNSYNSFNNAKDVIKLRVVFETSSPILALEQQVNAGNELVKSRFNEDKTKYEIEMVIKEKRDNFKRNTNKFNYYSDEEDENENHKKYLPLVSLEFQIEGYEKPKLYKQYDPINNETSFLLSYFKIKENQDENNITKSFPGLYYFIIDQSGSMSGKPIKLVIQTLKVFMQSLSKGSYYQLIGFGSEYRKYSPKPLLYTRENVNETLKQIEGLKGDMGGTNLDDPLSYVYRCRENDDLHLPQHIFILTDGYTQNAKNVLDSIEKNSSRYQVYAYGMGNDFDKEFIRTAGELGYGSYKFINDIENLSVTISQQLQKCMREYYDKVKFNVEQNDNNKLIYDFYRNEFILENQLVNYSFIMEGKINGNISIKNSYNQGEKEFNECFKFDENQILNLKDGNILSKITIHDLILKGQGESFSEEKSIKSIAKKYQVLCEYTSLFAEIENTIENKEAKLQQIKIEYNNDRERYYNNNANNNSHKYSLFGSNNNTGGPLFPLFGTNNTGGSLFGNNNTGGGLFSNNNTNNTNNLYGTVEGLFGTHHNTNDQIRKRNIFSSNNERSAPNGFFFEKNNSNNDNINNCKSKHNGEFGLFDNPTEQRNEGLFGNSNSQSSFGLFGNSNNQSGGGLFGNSNNQSGGGLFGNSNKQSGGGLFGNSNNQSGGGLFGNINNQYNDNENYKGKEYSGSLFGNNNIYSSNEEEERNVNEYKLNDNNNKEQDNIENIIMSLDIIDGFWDENEYTKSIIEMKRDIYNKVKSLVNDNKIAITFIILYYILNDRKDKIAEYLNIINKAKTFLVNSGHSYENIISSIV